MEFCCTNVIKLKPTSSNHPLHPDSPLMKSVSSSPNRQSVALLDEDQAYDMSVF